MMEDTLLKFKEQHLNNYKLAILETIKNNTNVLVDEDLMSLIKKPPLDSMDVIKTKFLDLAKKNHIILNIEGLDHMMDKYRKDLAKSGAVVKKERLDILNDLINSYKFEKDTDIFKIRKKDLEVVNKKIKKILKDDLKEYVEKDIIKNIKKLFNEVEDETKMKKIVDDITKFVNGTYQRQLLENIDIKILVKDTTLINGVKEQSERYLFTLENSRLFNEK